MMDGVSGDALVENAKAIRSKADFAAFLRLLVRNYREHLAEWENDSLELYLEGLAGFTEDVEGHYSTGSVKVDLDRPGWRVFADILLAARVYE